MCFAAAAYTPGYVTNSNIKIFCDAANHNHLTSMELAVKCDCLADEELGPKAAFIHELCLVRDWQLFVELEPPDMLEISLTIYT